MNSLEVKKTIGIRLNTLVSQDIELKKLFEAFRIGINWSLLEIEKRYQNFLAQYQPLPEKIEGICSGCRENKPLAYCHLENLYCVSCAMKNYSEYTIRKEIYGVGERTVEADLKNVIEIPNKTHYTMLFSQAYSMWKSYNSWRKKRIFEKERAQNELEKYPDQVLLDAAWGIERKTTDIKLTNPKLIWKQAKALAVKEISKDFSDEEKEEISKLNDKIIDLKKLSRPIHFPQLKQCRTVMMNAGFVTVKDDKLFLTLFEKKPQEVDFYGKEYLKKYLPLMEADSVYCNLTLKGNQYYLMYPLAIKVRQPPNIDECDSFVFMTSPTKTAIFGYDADRCLNSVKWFSTGEIARAKRHFKEKRAEIARRKSPDEKMRRIRKRKKSIIGRGNVEQRYVSTSNHQLTRKMIDYVMSQSENPKILIWDIGNGITQNFGSRLNYLKNLWAGVQQQEYIRHKAMQLSIPVIELKYNLCNDLICSSCGVKQTNGKKPAKVITQLIKGIKNFKCERCGYEINMLINQANNIINIK